MPPRLRGKWALGITPRNLTWILKDKLAICERPGGYGDNHRRVRRQEEIIWIRENGFGCVISLIPAPHNLHNYDELGVHWAHWPLPQNDTLPKLLDDRYTELRGNLAAGRKGSLGSSGNLLASTERERQLGLQLGDIQARGLESAYQNAQTQFERDRAAQMGVGQQNLNAALGVQQLGTQTGLQAALANLNNQQQANVANQAAQMQAAGMNAQQDQGGQIRHPLHNFGG